MKALFTDSGFMIMKWSVSSPDILNEILEQNCAPMARNLCAHSFNPGTQGAMGLNWLPEDLLTLCTLHGAVAEIKRIPN